MPNSITNVQVSDTTAAEHSSKAGPKKMITQFLKRLKYFSYDPK